MFNNTGVGLTTKFVAVVENAHPSTVTVYVTELVPAVVGQNVPFTTLGPDHTPPAGVPTKGSQGSPSQNSIETIVGAMLYISTSKNTVGLTHPSELVAKTLTPFVIKPAGAVLQSTVI
jgi:hypothetical protein